MTCKFTVPSDDSLPGLPFIHIDYLNWDMGDLFDLWFLRNAITYHCQNFVDVRLGWVITWHIKAWVCWLIYALITIDYLIQITFIIVPSSYLQTVWLSIFFKLSQSSLRYGWLCYAWKYLIHQIGAIISTQTMHSSSLCRHGHRSKIDWIEHPKIGEWHRIMSSIFICYMWTRR